MFELHLSRIPDGTVVGCLGCRVCHAGCGSRIVSTTGVDVVMRVTTTLDLVIRNDRARCFGYEQFRPTFADDRWHVRFGITAISKSRQRTQQQLAKKPFQTTAEIEATTNTRDTCAIGTRQPTRKATSDIFYIHWVASIAAKLASLNMDAKRASNATQGKYLRPV